MKAFILSALALLGACSESAYAERKGPDSEPTCEDVRHRYAALTVTHRTLSARGYTYSTRQAWVERAQLAEKHPECFWETDLGELR